MSDLKTCTKCSVEKPLTKFTPDVRYKDGYCSWCHDCKSASARARYSREDARKRALKNRYHLSLEEYEAIYQEQGGACAVCEENFEQLHVDHDHTCCPGEYTCGKCLRGLLCGNCNRALGLLKDDPRRIERLLSYLSLY